MEKVLGRRTDDLNYCYSLHGRSVDEPINENIYKKFYLKNIFLIKII